MEEDYIPAGTLVSVNSRDRVILDDPFNIGKQKTEIAVLINDTEPWKNMVDLFVEGRIYLYHARSIKIV